MKNQIYFFPFTHITRHQYKTIQTFFPSVHFLSLSGESWKPWETSLSGEPGKLIPFSPSADVLTSMKKGVAQYREWAGIHKGNERNLKALLQKKPYFTDDSDVSAITSRLKGNGNGKIKAEQKESLFLRDLVFLQLAGLCDEQNEEIDVKLEKLDKSRDQLVSTLRGLEVHREDPEDKKKDGGEDPGALMTKERIKAWSRVTAPERAVGKKGEIPLLVTTSEAVFEHIQLICKDAINALDIDGIKVHEDGCKNKNEWQHQLNEIWVHANEKGDNRKNELDRVNDGCSITGQIKLAFFSGDHVDDLFNCSDGTVLVCLIKLK